MKLNNFFIIILLFFFSISCAKKEPIQKSELKEKSLELQVLKTYNEAMESLESGDVLYAAKKFNEVEILFPQSQSAPKAALMAAYAYYSQDYLGDAISELQRFIKIYPNYKDIDYAYYLMAICFYEQIVDETKDLQSIQKAKENFIIVTTKFPNTEYALDSEFKLDLINDVLASKEMYIGRYYFDKQKWIPAINRFRTVIDDYQRTIYTEEALHRLVEIYYILGLSDEAKKYANLLGYNYQSSKWYEQTYNVFNKKYKKKKKNKADKKNKITKTILNKIKSLTN
jgi:outer membrane protein assembly factor BamD